MIKFIVKCSMKLNDGDTALSEEYFEYKAEEMNEIIKQYAERAVDRTYVDSFSITVEIKR